MTDKYFKAEHLQRDLGTSAIRQGTVVVASQAIVLVVRTVSTMFLARLLTPVDFGLVAMVTAIATALFIFKDLGLCDAVIQWPSPTPGQISNLFWLNLAVSLGVSLCLVAASPLIAMFYHEPRLVGICIVWAAVLTIGGASAQHLALLKRGMFFLGVSVISVLAILIGSSIAVFMAYRGAGYWSLVVRDVATEAITAAGAWALCSWRPSLPSRQSSIRAMVSFGMHNIFSFIIRRSVRNLDRTLIGWRFGAQLVGFYSNAFELAAMPASQISDALRNVAVSALAKLRDEPKRYVEYYLKAIRSLSLLGFGSAALLVVVSQDLIALVLGPKWSEAAKLFAILGLGSGPMIIYLTHVWLHFSLGRADRLARWTVMQSVVFVVAFVIGLPFGVKGVAWGCTIATYVLTVWGLWYAGRPIGLRFSRIVGAMWLPFVASAMAGVLTTYLAPTSARGAGHLALILVSVLFFVPLYLGFILLLAGSYGPLLEAVRVCRIVLRMPAAAEIPLGTSTGVAIRPPVSRPYGKEVQMTPPAKLSWGFAVPSVTEHPEIVAIQATDLVTVAEIHCVAFQENVLTRLGHGAVLRYYEWQLIGPHEVVAFLARTKNGCLGFIFAGVSMDVLPGFVRRNKWYLARQLLCRPRLFAEKLTWGRIGKVLKILIGSEPTRTPLRSATQSAKQASLNVLMIATDPKFQGQGVARQLMLAVEDYARKERYLKMYLTVSLQNARAIRLYERLGWEKVLQNGIWTGGMRKFTSFAGERSDPLCMEQPPFSNTRPSSTL